MIKAVNMKGYRFGKTGSIRYVGFGMLDEESNSFFSFDGKTPYVLPVKKIIQSCIDAGWQGSMVAVKQWQG